MEQILKDIDFFLKEPKTSHMTRLSYLQLKSTYIKDKILTDPLFHKNLNTYLNLYQQYLTDFDTELLIMKSHSH